MKGIFGPYVLWPLDKKLFFWIVTRVSARDYTVIEIHCSNVSTTSITARQWGAGNVYLLVLSCQKVNIAENPIVVMGL